MTFQFSKEGIHEFPIVFTMIFPFHMFVAGFAQSVELLTAERKVTGFIPGT